MSLASGLTGGRPFGDELSLLVVLGEFVSICVAHGFPIGDGFAYNFGLFHSGELGLIVITSLLGELLVHLAGDVFVLDEVFHRCFEFNMRSHKSIIT